MTNSNTSRNAVSIDVWRSYNCETQYSISLCDEDGEIKCLGGADDVADAWSEACELADQYGLPAQHMLESGEVMDTYTPEPATKGDVDSRTWDTAASYVATFDGDPYDGACDVEVQIGSAGAGQCERWFVRTRDDAGGSDEADDTAYESESEAREAAEEFAADNQEGDDGEDAEDYLRRCTESRVGDEDARGAWCVYWVTALEDEGPRERYATREQADAAVELANEALHRANPGHLLCGFEARELVDGEWVARWSER